MKVLDSSVNNKPSDKQPYGTLTIHHIDHHKKKTSTKHFQIEKTRTTHYLADGRQIKYLMFYDKNGKLTLKITLKGEFEDFNESDDSTTEETWIGKTDG